MEHDLSIPRRVARMLASYDPSLPVDRARIERELVAATGIRAKRRKTITNAYSRSLRTLERDGLIERCDKEIRILDRVGLFRRGYGPPGP